MVLTQTKYIGIILFADIVPLNDISHLERCQKLICIERDITDLTKLSVFINTCHTQLNNNFDTYCL